MVYCFKSRQSSAVVQSSPRTDGERNDKKWMKEDSVNNSKPCKAGERCRTSGSENGNMVFRMVTDGNEKDDGRGWVSIRGCRRGRVV